MAGEISTTYATGATLYFVVRNVAGQVWNGSAFEAFNGSHQPSYANALIEQGAGSGFYLGNFPTAITSAGTYEATAYKQSGGSPSSGDTPVAAGQIEWDGTAESVPSNCDLITVDYAGQFANATIPEYIVSAASQAVKTYCNDNFCLTQYAEFYDGEGSTRLVLNQTPIVAIQSVTLNVNDTTAQTVDGSNYIFNPRSGVMRLKDTAFSFVGNAFFNRGFQNIYVLYQAGYATIPSDLQTATALIAQRLWLLKGKDLTLKSERIGDYNYTNDALKVISDDIKALLAKYKRYTV